MVMSTAYAAIGLFCLILLECMLGAQGTKEKDDCATACGLEALAVNTVLEAFLETKFDETTTTCIKYEKGLPCLKKKCGVTEKEVEDAKKEIGYSQNCAPSACSNKASVQLVTEMVSSGLNDKSPKKEFIEKGCPIMTTFFEKMEKCSELNDEDKKGWKDRIAKICNKSATGNSASSAMLHVLLFLGLATSALIAK